MRPAANSATSSGTGEMDMQQIVGCGPVQGLCGLMRAYGHEQTTRAVRDALPLASSPGEPDLRSRQPSSLGLAAASEAKQREADANERDGCGFGDGAWGAGGRQSAHSELVETHGVVRVHEFRSEL